jgi:hypothetical protein
MAENDPLFGRKIEGGAILLQATFEGRFTRDEALAASRTVLREAARIDGIRKDILLEGDKT